MPFSGTHPSEQAPIVPLMFFENSDWPLWKPEPKHGRLFYIHRSSKIPPLLLYMAVPFGRAFFDQVVGAEGQSLG